MRRGVYLKGVASVASHRSAISRGSNALHSKRKSFPDGAESGGETHHGCLSEEQGAWLFSRPVQRGHGSDFATEHDDQPEANKCPSTAVCDSRLVKTVHAGLAARCDESVGLSHRCAGNKAWPCDVLRTEYEYE